MSTEFQSYSSRSNAFRGFARQFSGINPTPFIIQTDASWGFFPDEVMALAEISVETKVPPDLPASMHREKLPGPGPGPGPRYQAPAADGRAGGEAQPIQGVAVVARRRSPTKGAVKACWEFFYANPGLRRKDAVAAMVENGVAFFTARTQYQRWFTARPKTNAETPIS